MDDNPVFMSIRAALPELTKSESRIARYILNNEARIGLETGASLARVTRVSEITVSRFLKKLGYKGLRELKLKLRQQKYDTGVLASDRQQRLLSESDGALIEAESSAILKLAGQIIRPEWQSMIQKISETDRIFITGFQTVQGMSEDFSRRLGFVRDAVRFISAYEGGLVEWVSPSRSLEGTSSLLIMLDILPYSRQAEPICRIAEKNGIEVVVLTDEFNNWAYSYTDLVFHAVSKTGFYLETTATLNAMLNIIIHAVAELDPESTRLRVENWLETTRDLELF